MNKLVYGLVWLALLGSTACGSKKENTPKEKYVPSENVEENKKRFNKPVIEENSYASTPGANTNTPQVDTNGEVTITDPNYSPETVVRTIIKAAKTHNYSQLLKLTTQVVKMDGDAQKICNMASESEEEQKSFSEYFANAFVGETRIKNNTAEVDITTTTKKGKEQETIVVEQKYGKWYLKGL